MRAYLLGAAAIATAISTAGAASAQAESGFALNRFDPSERGSDWFSTDSLDLRGSGRLGIGVVGDWAHKPLVAYDEDNNEKYSLVRNQVYVHAGVTLVMWDRLRLGVNVPIAVMNESGDDPNATLSEGAKIGDVRVGADLRLFGTYGGAITGALGVQVHIPTGSRDAMTGDGKARIVPRFQVAGDISPFVYSARVGLNIRTLSDNFDGEPFGTEVLFGAAAGFRLADGRLVIGPEVYGSTVVSDSFDGAFARKTTPFEIIGGGHYKITESWRIGLGVGPGLTRGYGAPKLRVLASLEWVGAPPKECTDSDGDGICDEKDACPNERGEPNDDPRLNGCPPPPPPPPPSDRDNDGIIDDEDACPDEPGPRSDDPTKNGCPLPPDRDGDGIIDSEDACPDNPGPRRDDPNTTGCPDTDGDGIIDRDDACPELAGFPNADPKKHGCPRAIVTPTEIKIMERVEFDTGRATIRRESDPVLNAVLDILKTNPDIRLLRIEGHTDSQGSAFMNMNLSKARAAAVRKWLIDNGIEASRLTSAGFGQTKPIADNNTPEGRQENRRVAFEILERDKK
ncbi:MAG: OmpA family protein [Polyangiaceae bacterium]|nr:OmpA family protein [Polyangiaceae bacterium]